MQHMMIINNLISEGAKQVSSVYFCFSQQPLVHVDGSCAGVQCIAYHPTCVFLISAGLRPRDLFIHTPARPLQESKC